MSEQPPNKQTDTGFVAGFFKYMPIVQWALTIVIAIGLFAVSQRDSQTVQGHEIRETQEKVKAVESEMDRRRDEREKQMEEMKRTVLTREVFEAYHKADQERMTRLEKMIERLLENQTVR